MSCILTALESFVCSICEKGLCVHGNGLVRSAVGDISLLLCTICRHFCRSRIVGGNEARMLPVGLKQTFDAGMREEDADKGEASFLFNIRSAGLEDEWRPLSGGQQPQEYSEDELGRLDIDLDRKSRRHNLTSGNVRTILHEVITHERVVDMMKAAIRATQDMPMFEPKMTRSRLKRAIQQGQCLDWSLSTEQSLLHPQFVDIHLDADEDSSDEEYCPEDEDDDDTAEETFLSDGDVISPDKPCDSSSQRHSMLAAHKLTDTAGPSFLERLNAVEEELNCGPAYASLTSHRTEDVEEEEQRDEGSSGLAFRTRSKLRLVNVPLEQLEAALLPLDITADMYEQSPCCKEEDRHWARWLQGLMAADNQEEADDDDDPEYNFLDDLDEPDLEDYRTDRAVQITKREVNKLLEELFDTLWDDRQAEEEDEEDDEEEEEPEASPGFNVPQPLCLEPALTGTLTMRRREPFRRALQDTTNHPWPAAAPAPLLLPKALCPNSAHKRQLQRQIQQHVQLLAEVHLLSRGVGALKHEASVTKHFLEELQRFAVQQEQLLHASSFRACNLQGALDLLREIEHRVDLPPPPPPVSRRWLPVMSSSSISHAFPVLPSDTAWLLATRVVFLYPELLPVCNLDPSHHPRPHRSIFTAGEDGLIVLGLKHFEGAVQPEHLISSYLLCKSSWKLTKHIREMSSSRAPRENVLKMFLARQLATPLPLACARVQPGDQHPPVERDSSIMPFWLKNSHQVIQMTHVNACSLGYPRFLPKGCNLRLYPSRLQKPSRQPGSSQRRLFTLAHNASLQPICSAERKTELLLSSESEPRAIQASYFLLQRDATLQHASSAPVPTPNASIELGKARHQKASHCQQLGRRQTHASEGDERHRGEGQGRCGEEREPAEEGQGEEEEQEGVDEGAGEEVGREGEEAGKRQEEEQEAREEGQGEEQEQGDGEKDEDREKQEEEEEEDDDDEDFDELTQDEDEEEEAMSSASEESLLSIPELQETMKQLARLASRRRPAAESEEDHSPGSQEEDEEEEESPKNHQAARRTAAVVSEDEDAANAGEEEASRGGRRGGGRRGRGQPSRALGGTRRARREHHRKDQSKVCLLYDENMLENDPQRQSKDVAFAQSYLDRVREALHDVPEKMEEFVALLNDLERLEGREVVCVFRKLRCILGSRTELMRDFAAFLHPEQALECGLFQEQQAFERSRRFLRQLEITFGDNPSHYSKIIKALQPGPHLSPAGVNELKAQMAALLKGHPHLQAEFWVFFDELRPPPACPGQFEEAHWPEEGGTGEGPGHLIGAGADGAFEEVTLPDVDMDEDGHKMDATLSRRQRRKLRLHAADEESNWLCFCHHSKSRTHRRRGCARCHANKVRTPYLDHAVSHVMHPVQASGGVSGAMKSLEPLYAQIGFASEDKDGETKVAECQRAGVPSWERSFLSVGDVETDDGDTVESPLPKRKRGEELHPPFLGSSSPAPDLPVRAKNISVTPSGEKVILWTREADRVILTTCRQEGANQNTFQGISGRLGNKTPGEVSRRFRDLMRLFQSATRNAGSEDEAPPTELVANEEQE
ncbi:GON-4-like protein isoform X5 [Syngnathus acus]|uniref:GON-4-like protein isoform X5 n=1 Tax=Syngnathus acus TaxID=161584 RepID=UPI001885BE2A|nr:GON-4-like protein isoform X5 [Syngnathus acus]